VPISYNLIQKKKTIPIFIFISHVKDAIEDDDDDEDEM
jgi:hypothetical protein